MEDECPVGFWCTSGKIIPCGEAYWSNTTGEFHRTACKPCPDFSTSSPASTSPADCVCVPGYYDARLSFSTSAPVCAICMAGTYCNKRNTTIATLPVNIGYYRVSTSSTDLHQCIDSAVNCSVGPDGTYGRCLDGASGCRGGTYDPALNLSYPGSQCAAAPITQRPQIPVHSVHGAPLVSVRCTDETAAFAAGAERGCRGRCARCACRRPTRARPRRSTWRGAPRSSRTASSASPAR